MSTGPGPASDWCTSRYNWNDRCIVFWRNTIQGVYWTTPDIWVAEHIRPIASLKMRQEPFPSHVDSAFSNLLMTLPERPKPHNIMDMMDQSAYWPAQRTDSLPLESPTTEGNESHLQLLYGMQNPGLESQFARHGTARLSLSELNTDVLKSGFTSPDSTKSGSPELYFDPSAFSERQSSTSDGSRSNLSSQEQGQKLANRRIQNRAAQRRFRERRDEQNKILQAKLAELQENYQKLSEELTKKSEEVSHLRSENEGLRAEVRNQRQRWRSIVLLLQRPKSLQLLSMLVGGEQGTEGSEADSGIGDLDRYLRCLDAFTLSDDKA